MLRHPQHSILLEQGDSCPYCTPPDAERITSPTDNSSRLCTALQIRPDFEDVSVSMVNCYTRFKSRILCADKIDGHISVTQTQTEQEFH